MAVSSEKEGADVGDSDVEVPVAVGFPVAEVNTDNTAVDASNVGGPLDPVVPYVIALVVVAHVDSTTNNGTRYFPHQAVEVVGVR